VRRRGRGEDHARGQFAAPTLGAAGGFTWDGRRYMLRKFTHLRGIAHASLAIRLHCHARPNRSVRCGCGADQSSCATRLSTGPGGAIRGDPSTSAAAAAGRLHLASRALGVERLCLSLGEGRLCPASAENAPMGEWRMGTSGRSLGLGGAALALTLLEIRDENAVHAAALHNDALGAQASGLFPVLGG
jgi:hypothetical protein